MKSKGITVPMLAYTMEVEEGSLRYALQHPTPIWEQHIRDTLEAMESCKSGAYPN